MNESLSLPALMPLLNATPLNKGQVFDDARSYSQVALGVSTDSRTLKQGELFVALQGETFDGHGFLHKAEANGAIAAIVHKIPLNLEALSIPVLQVEDTLVAYQRIGHWWRHQFQIPIIAITGSVGKTTTKELIAAVLSTQGTVLKTQANYNNEIGVPKTLLQLNASHSYAVVEMGMRGPGEIATLTQIATPDIAVITNVGTAHIGRLGSESAIAQAKCELLTHLPSQGTAILNYDNARLMETASSIWQGKTLTYGLTGGDIKGTMIAPDRLSVSGLADATIECPLPLIGNHNALNYLAALAVASVFGLGWAPIIQGVEVTLPAGRAQRYCLPNDVIVLDETYNAGYESMTAALSLLANTPGQRHIAVLGTMKELGDWSVELHKRVGATVRALGLDALFILADPSAQEALAAGSTPVPTYPCSTPAELIEALQNEIQEGDRLLFKASRSVGLDHVVEQFRQQWGA
ncbi:MAG: UDP-N-acetylmuramoyl-tripeptide--D-alanyl-D-alanine ligase [Symploca sp. SIO2B6]|nr:UDP-N-acetylmuramoyl-tripeptide--D-alanyl-D-alanine ligase [Symploca sp. SIO2B6]